MRRRNPTHLPPLEKRPPSRVRISYGGKQSYSSWTKDEERTPQCSVVWMRPLTVTRLKFPINNSSEYVTADTVIAARANHSTTVAANLVGEASKKGVSWGTVKTHTVHVIETDDDEDSKQVSAGVASDFTSFARSCFHTRLHSGSWFPLGGTTVWHRDERQ